MKEIKLTRGKVAQVDDEDFIYLSQFKWHADPHPNTYYAKRYDRESKKSIPMHREIMRPAKGQLVDHKDINGLNNQRSNLRIATRAQNSANCKSYKGSFSKYLGVHWHKKDRRWEAKIRKNGVRIYIGRFRTEEDAAMAYNKSATEFHGEFASLNIIPLDDKNEKQ